MQPPPLPAARARRAVRAGWLLAALALAGVAEVAPAQRARPPRSGRELLARMHDRYAGRWFRTLTFVQTTEVRRPDGTDTTETWYEALRAPDRLRIDRGAPSEGNGMLFTPESTYVARGGKVVRATATGNELIPFVAGVYTQPVDSTLRDLAALPVDMGRVGEGKWRGRRAYIVGAANAADSLAPQFWVDRDRLVLVRIVLPPGAEGGPVRDVHFDRYVRLGDAWLATEVTLWEGATRVLHERYSDYTADPPLPDALFDPAAWSEAEHWTSGAARRP
jgi:hypothetical protein